jgi:hypothetical protein
LTGNIKEVVQKNGEERRKRPRKIAGKFKSIHPQKKDILTATDNGVEQFAVLLPLHPDTARILPITRVGFIHLVQSAQA